MTGLYSRLLWLVVGLPYCLFSLTACDTQMRAAEIPAAGSALSASTPNILIILADDMGVDTLDLYGFSQDTANTPHLDALAQSGLWFANAWATPACSTTRAALLTGQYGSKTGVTKVPGTLPQGSQVLLSQLRNLDSDKSYTSALFGKWHLGGRSADPSHPNSFGIDHFVGNVRGNISDYYDWLVTENGRQSQSEIYHTRVITDAAIGWIADQSSAPWVAWVAYSAPHAPFHTPPKELQVRALAGTESDLAANKRAYYLAAIEAMDSEIGRLLDALPIQQRQNTLIVFLGDNGTPRSVIDRSVFPGRHGKSSLYEGGIRVPFIVAGAGIKAQSAPVDSLINIVDVFPTLTQLLGGKEAGNLQGQSFASLLQGIAGPSRAYNYAEYDGGWAVRDANYKYIRQTDGSEEFYEIGTSGFERTNIISQPGAAAQAAGLIAYGEAQHDQTLPTQAALPVNPQQRTQTGYSCAAYVGAYTGTGNDVARDVTFDSILTITSQDRTCLLQTSSIPDHAFNDGPRAFPNPAMPVPKRYIIPQNPTRSERPTPLSLRYDNAVLLNGVKVDLLAAGCFGVGDGKIGCNQMNTPWRYDPMHSAAGFNVDSHHAHTQPDGAYHYHAPPPFILENVQTPDTVIGFAADGFPIFGPRIETANGIRTARSSYRLKSGARPSGAGQPGGTYDGTYRDDYEYVAGSGDLDACNGAMIDGQYGYVATARYPYLLGCFMGTPDESFNKRGQDRRGDRRGQGRRGEGRRGERRNGNRSRP